MPNAQPSHVAVAKALLPHIEEEMARRGLISTKTVVGMVAADGTHTHSIRRHENNHWQPCIEKPDVFMPSILERALTTDKRNIVLYGGRGSSKSVTGVDICVIDARDMGAKTYCLREYQSSIAASVHSLIKEEIERLEFDNFEVTDKAIKYNGEIVFSFAGIQRNTSSIKSAHGFKRFLVEEAQFLSKESIRILLPTARNKPNRGLPGDLGEAIEQPGVSFIFIANLGSTEDPFSQEFIIPYLSELDECGFYEDDLRLIIRMNYTDNPWFKDSGMELQRQDEYEKLPRALYHHIWNGAFNDSVDDALIMSEWFDACEDAHIKMGWEPRGAKIASHDPSDMGADAKAYAMRHGSVFLRIEEKHDGNVNDGGHWAAGLAIQDGVDAYSWEGDGMGAGLAEQNAKDLEGKKIDLSVFVSGSGPDFPDALYKPALASPVANQRTNKQTFKNKRSQYSWELRDRIYRTYRAVIHGEYADPDDCISFSSDLPLLSKIRAEICRVPIKPNGSGLNELYDKETMRTKFKIASPNLFDAIKQTMRYIPSHSKENVYIPKPTPPMRKS